MTLFFATIWTFFLLNFSLYKFAPDNFKVSGNPSAFDFFRHSFYAVFLESVKEIEPASVYAKSLVMVSIVVMTFLLLVVVTFVVTSLQKDRDDKHMDAIMEAIKLHAEKQEQHIGKQFGLDIVQAVKLLQKSQAAFIGAIYYLSPSFKPLEEQDASEK